MSEGFEEQKNMLLLVGIKSPDGCTSTQAWKVSKGGDEKYSTLASRITWPAIYVQRNIEGHWRKHCSRGKEISITYSECVFIALLIRHSKRMRVSYCHVWPLRLYSIFNIILRHFSF